MTPADHPYPTTNPFPGLRPYDESDSHLFFGREDQIHELLGRLRNLRFLAVLGNSGCGKSSLVRAGLLPTLRDGFMAERPDGWRIGVMRPGNSPLRNLAQVVNSSALIGSGGPGSTLEESLVLAALNRGDFALADLFQRSTFPADTKYLVVVDQFEELFRFHREGFERDAFDEAQRFIQLLLTAAGQREVPIYVILTMRSEFLGHCNPFSGLPEAINDGLYLVPRLSREQLRDAIEQPIRLFEGTITNRLVNRLLNNLGEEMDQLPVLQHALSRLWSLGQEQSPGNPPNLDIELYDGPRIGGISQALSRHVEELLQQLDANQGRIAQIMFRNLTAVADNGELVRNPTRLETIARLSGVGVEQVATVIESFRGEGKSFLMPPAPEPLSADKTIDISHESLIRQWERLKTWTREEHRSRRIRKMLTEESARWKLEGVHALTNKDFLLQGKRLADALEWRDTHIEEFNLDIMAQEREFLTSSEAQRDAEIRRQEEQQQRELELQQSRMRILAFGAIAAGLAAILMGYLWVAARNAEATAVVHRKKAKWVSRAAHVELAWLSWMDFAPIHAWEHLALAFEQSQAKGSEYGLLVSAFGTPAKTFSLDEQVVSSMTWSSQGKQLAVGTNSHLFRFSGLGQRTLDEISPTSHVENGFIRCLTWMECDDQAPILVSGGSNGEINLWSSDNNTQPLATATVPPIGATREASDDSARVITCVTAIGKCRQIVTGDKAGRLIAWKWNKSRLEQFRVGQCDSNQLEILVAHPDQRHIVSVDKNGRVTVWDVEDGTEHWEPIYATTLRGRVTALAISRDEKLMATADDDGMIRLWAMQIVDRQCTVSELENSDQANAIQLKGHVGPVNALVFAPDGRLVSAGEDGTMRVWKIPDERNQSDDYRRPRVLMRHRDVVYALAVWDSDGGCRIASGGFDSKLVVGDLAEEPESRHSEADAGHFKSVAVSRDGTRVVRGRIGNDEPILANGVNAADSSGDSSDSETGDRLDDVLSVAFGGEGDRIVASGTRRGVIRVWKVDDDKLRPTGLVFNTPLDESAYSVAIDPRGELLLCGLANGKLVGWKINEQDSFRQSPAVFFPISGDLRTYSRNPFGKLHDEDTAVYSMSFNSDGDKLVTGHKNGTIWLWERTSRGITKPKYVGRHKLGSIYSVAFLPKSKSQKHHPTRSRQNRDLSVILSAGLRSEVFVWVEPDGSLFESDRALIELYDDLTIRHLLVFPTQSQNTIGIAFVPAKADTEGQGHLYSFSTDGRAYDVLAPFSGDARRQSGE